MTAYSIEATRYMVWAAAVGAGVLLAVIDRHVLGRMVFGGVILTAIAAGLLLSDISPFSFGATSYYMHGVIVAGAGLLALAGYLPARVAMALAGRSKRQGY